MVLSNNDEQVAKIVGEQQATIEQLRQSQDVKEFSVLFNQSIALQREIKDLKEENEQLRQILKDIVEVTDETYTKNTSMFKVTVVLDYEKYREIRRCIDLYNVLNKGEFIDL